MKYIDFLRVVGVLLVTAGSAAAGVGPSGLKFLSDLTGLGGASAPIATPPSRGSVARGEENEAPSTDLVVVHLEDCGAEGEEGNDLGGASSTSPQECAAKELSVGGKFKLIAKSCLALALDDLEKVKHFHQNGYPGVEIQDKETHRELLVWTIRQNTKFAKSLIKMGEDLVREPAFGPDILLWLLGSRLTYLKERGERCSEAVASSKKGKQHNFVSTLPEEYDRLTPYDQWAAGSIIQRHLLLCSLIRLCHDQLDPCDSSGSIIRYVVQASASLQRYLGGEDEYPPVPDACFIDLNPVKMQMRSKERVCIPIEKLIEALGDFQKEGLLKGAQVLPRKPSKKDFKLYNKLDRPAQKERKKKDRQERQRAAAHHAAEELYAAEERRRQFFEERDQRSRKEGQRDPVAAAGEVATTLHGTPYHGGAALNYRSEIVSAAKEEKPKTRGIADPARAAEEGAELPREEDGRAVAMPEAVSPLDGKDKETLRKIFATRSGEVTYANAVRLLGAVGCVIDPRLGSHVFVRKGNQATVLVRLHGGRDTYGPGTLGGMRVFLRGCGIVPEGFEAKNAVTEGGAATAFSEEENQEEERGGGAGGEE